MTYEVDIYEADNNYRYVLGKNGSNPLFVLGVNPSTATNVKPDTTITKIKNFSEQKGFDGWVTLNLYPQRTTKPSNLHQDLKRNLHEQNIKEIVEIISRYQNPTIWAAWGNIITIRPYLKECLIDIQDSINRFNPNWIQVGEFTKKGHPRHPSRLPYNTNKSDFDIEKYIEIMTK